MKKECNNRGDKTGILLFILESCFNQEAMQIVSNNILPALSLELVGQLTNMMKV